jgi:ectoine hydroxylase-related dioxygenase (phytanoyl-CoA dioxygenase family)
VLNNDQYVTYWEKGFLVIRSVLDEQDIRALHDECERLALLTDEFDALVEPRKSLDGSMVRERMEALSDLSPVFHELACDERLLAPVRQLFQAGACLFKDKVHFRPPGTTGFRLHQDHTAYAFAGVPPADIITIMIAIDPVTKASGALEVFPGYHHELLPEPANDPRAADPDSVDLSVGELVELEPCDICAFHSLTPHRSSPNISDRSRRTAFLTYNHARHGDRYRAYYAGREDLYQ